jgi:intracellular multiplication protein IcmL
MADSDKSQPESAEEQKAEELVKVKMNNNFYKDSYTKILFVMLLSITLNFGLASAVLYVIANPPQAKYFATSINGRITPLSPLDKPNQADSAILQWANQAAIATFTYNFVNYQNELQSASRYFTRSGWGQFLTALRNSGNLDMVKSKKLIVSAVATRAPVILQKGPLGGRYAWRIQMPILVTYQSASEFRQQNNVVTILVKRVSTLETPRGIGISQYLVGRAAQIV